MNEADPTLADDPADLYVYDASWRVSAVGEATPTRDAGGAVTGWTTPRLRERYVYAANRSAADGQGGDTPLGREMDLDGDGVFERQQFFLEDRQGSVAGVMERRDADADGLWDGDARLIARVAYTAFGEPEIYRPTDVDRDGDVDLADWQQYHEWYDDFDADVNGAAKYKGFLDWNLDGKAGGLAGNPARDADEDAFELAYFADLDDQAIEGSAAEYLGAMPLYAGYWWDPHVRLYHVRHRVYDPQSGRWLQRDPIGYDGGPNLYGSTPLYFVSAVFPA